MYWRPLVLWDVKQRRSVDGYRRFRTRLLNSLRGNDRLSQNVGNQLHTSAAQRPKTAKASSWHKYGGQAMKHSTFRNCICWHFFAKLANVVDIIILGSVTKQIWSSQKCVHESCYKNVYLSNDFKLKCKTSHQKSPFTTALTVFLSLISQKLGTYFGYGILKLCLGTEMKV
jgi:hypothetical protein